MAAGLFAQLVEQVGDAGRWQIGSAGTWAVENLPAMSLARSVMQQHDVNIDAHRSRMLTGEMLHATDVVLVMTRNQYEAICAEFPAEASKVFLLSQLLGQRFDIEDPINGPIEDYRHCADDLQHILRTGYTRLTELAQRTSADDSLK